MKMQLRKQCRTLESCSQIPVALWCLGEKATILILTLSLPGDPCLIFSLFNISTMRHVTTCNNALKSVDSNLETEHYLMYSQISAAQDSLGTMHLTHINSAVILTSSSAEKKRKKWCFYLLIALLCLWGCTCKIETVLHCMKLQDTKSTAIHHSALTETLVEEKHFLERNYLEKTLIFLNKQSCCRVSE